MNSEAKPSNVQSHYGYNRCQISLSGSQASASPSVASKESMVLDIKVYLEHL